MGNIRKCLAMEDTIHGSTAFGQQCFEELLSHIFSAHAQTFCKCFVKPFRLLVLQVFLEKELYILYSSSLS